MDNIVYYILLLGAIIGVVFLIKKVAGCLVRTAIFIVLLIIVICVYIMLAQ